MGWFENMKLNCVKMIFDVCFFVGVCDWELFGMFLSMI